jgi:hypothetical protein
MDNGKNKIDTGVLEFTSLVGELKKRNRSFEYPKE